MFKNPRRRSTFQKRICFGGKATFNEFGKVNMHNFKVWVDKIFMKLSKIR